MTMPRAIALLVFSVLLTAAGVVLLFVRVQDGLVNSSNPSYSSGAFSGDAAATPQGAGSTSGGVADATAAAARREITARAATQAALLTPFPTGTGAAGRGGAVAIGEPITVGNSRFTVHQVADPEPPGFFPTNPGSRRVAIEVTQEALSGTVQYNFPQFRLRDGAATVHTWATANSTPSFASGTLQSGESRRGWLSFQVPLGVELDALIFQPLGAASAVVIVALR